MITTTITAEQLKELVDKAVPEIQKDISRTPTGKRLDALVAAADACSKAGRIATYCYSLSPYHPITVSLDLALILKFVP